jgi:hypothetical protein
MVPQHSIQAVERSWSAAPKPLIAIIDQSRESASPGLLCWRSR